MLKEKIIDDRKQAMINKQPEKRLVLGTLIGELDRESKDPSDSDVIRIIKKMVENNEITHCEHENIYLKEYLPKLLEKEQLEEIIKQEISNSNLIGKNSIGKIMSFLNNKYVGQYNGQDASSIARNLLI